MIDIREVTLNGQQFLVCGNKGRTTRSSAVFVIDNHNRQILEEAWYYNEQTGYMQREGNYVHRRVFNLSDDALRVDHKTRWKLDDREINLRSLTQTEQNINTAPRARSVTLPEGCGILPEEIPTNITYTPDSNIGHFTVDVHRYGEHVFRHDRNPLNYKTLREKLDYAIGTLEAFKSAHPQYFPPVEFTAEQERLIREYNEIIDLSGLAADDYAKFKATIQPRRTYHISSPFAVEPIFKRTSADFKLLYDKEGTPISGVMTKAGHKFLYDVEDHHELSQLNWSPEWKRDKTLKDMRIDRDANDNSTRVRRLATFTTTKVSMKTFIFSAFATIPEGQNVTFFTGNKQDRRRKNLQLGKGTERDTPTNPAVAALLQQTSMPAEDLPRFVTANLDRDSFYFNINLPWFDKAKAILKGKGEPEGKVQKLKKFLTDQYASQGMSFAAEDDVRAVFQAEFADAMRAAA